MRALIAAMAVLASAALASAEPVEIEGVRFAPSAQVGGQTLVLNGAGLRTRAFFKVYAAGLYVPQAARTPAALLAQTGPRRVVISMLREVDADQFVTAFTGGLEDNNSEAQRAALASQIAAFQANLKGLGVVHQGDVLHFEYTPETGTRILRAGQPQGAAIPGAEFFTAVLRVWLGEHPVDAGLKRGFLGL